MLISCGLGAQSITISTLKRATTVKCKSILWHNLSQRTTSLINLVKDLLSPLMWYSFCLTIYANASSPLTSFCTTVDLSSLPFTIQIPDYFSTWRVSEWWGLTFDGTARSCDLYLLDCIWSSGSGSSSVTSRTAGICTKLQCSSPRSFTTFTSVGFCCTLLIGIPLKFWS